LILKANMQELSGRWPVKKLNCWEFNKCGRAHGGDVRAACPASVEAMLDGIHGGLCAGRACWTVAGTMCKGKVMGVYAEKLESCTKCAFYREVKKQEGEDFMDVSVMLRHVESGVPVMGLARNDVSPTEADETERLFSDTLAAGLKRAYDDCGYCESRFVHMVKDLGALKAVKRMLNKQQFLYGLSVLRRCSCIVHSPERLVLDYRFSFLFSEGERLTALARLRGSVSGGLEDILLGEGGSSPERTH
jgi:hypothetical protein